MSMKSVGFLLATLVVTLSPEALFANDHPPHYNPCGKPEYSYAGDDPLFANYLTPGIPWPALDDILNAHWTNDEITHNTLFEPAKIEQAIHWAVDKTEPPDLGWGDFYEEYHAPASATALVTKAYEDAAKLYRDKDWQGALPAFDRVIADQHSPYRAAAAYSAARAALNLGLYHEALLRLEKIISDPSLHEFQTAAFHLIGTRAYQSGNPALEAAHYAEIEHILEAPPSVICHDTAAREVYGGTEKRSYWEDSGWAGDLTWYLRSAFTIVHGTRREVLDALAQHDAFYDLVRALAAPTPYSNDRGWLDVGHRDEPFKHNKKSKRKDADGINDELDAEEAITKHAREQWLQTKNVLWGYALAERTSAIDDLPLIKDMLLELPKLPETEALTYAKGALHSHFVQHATRLLLMNGQVDEAIAFLRENPIETTLGTTTYSYNANPAHSLLNGGIRLLLEKFDLNNARKWVSQAGPLLPDTQIDQGLRPLLTTSFDEFLADQVPGDDHKIWGSLHAAHHEGELPLEVIDFLPTSKILALAAHSGVAANEKRALLSAGWLRTYLLEGPQAGLGLLPKLRSSFPELATDIDDIDEGSSFSNKDHLLTRMLLRTPGFSYRPSWARPAQSARLWSYGQNVDSLFAIDSYNPNDGNWWCAADISQIKMEMVEKFFLNPLELENRQGLYVDPMMQSWLYWYPFAPNKEAQQNLNDIADKVIAWHPLLKDADMVELTKLSQVKSGPHMLSEKAVEWAKGTNFFTRWLGSDKYLPEILHLAVRSTRYGCRHDSATPFYSREAFKELHKLYPHSPWTAQTPYWFHYDDKEETRRSAFQNDHLSPFSLLETLKRKIKKLSRPILGKLHSLLPSGP